MALFFFHVHTLLINSITQNYKKPRNISSWCAMQTFYRYVFATWNLKSSFSDNFRKFFADLDLKKQLWWYFQLLMYFEVFTAPWADFVKEDSVDTLVPEVFLDFSSRKRSRASREAATTSRESDEEREKNLWLPWPRISLSCRRQGQDLTLGRWLVDIFSNTQTNLIGSFNCNYRGDAEDFHTSFCLSLPGKKIVCMLHSQ